MNRTPIEHVDCTWNVVTGCRHGCPYCYARKAAEEGPYLRGRHGYDAVHPFAPTFHPGRLGEPLAVKRPRLIFPSSMGDILGDWVPAEWISRTIAVCAEADWHRFLFLTKNPKRYREFAWPANCWIGTSTTGMATDDELARLDELGRAWQQVAGRTFVSLEPYTWGGLGDEVAAEPPLRWLKRCRASWVVCGAQTKPTRLPSLAALSVLVSDVRDLEIPLLLKDSLAPVWQAVYGSRPMPREWPEGLRLKYGKSARKDTPCQWTALEEPRERLWRWLQANAVGHARAVVIPEVAAALGATERQVQAWAAQLREEGCQVVTERTVPPLGMFVATTREELLRYAELLRRLAMPELRQARKMRQARPYPEPAEATLFDP